jgi:hypothetical protein
MIIEEKKWLQLQRRGEEQTSGSMTDRGTRLLTIDSSQTVSAAPSTTCAASWRRDASADRIFRQRPFSTFG